jgi:uncharacterized protein YjbI with pentapeptide repeats
MNDTSRRAAPQGLAEAPASFAPQVDEACDLRSEELRGRDLRGRDLTKVEGLLPEHLAGADLTSAKLPEEIAKFPALEQVKAISGEARKVFIGLLAACVYSWLVIGTTKDVQLIVNTATSPLPIINTAIPIAGFYVVGAAVLAAVYCYLHFYLQRLWRTLATLPAIFPDGVALDDKSDPWLLTNLVRLEFERLRPNAPPLVWLENWLAVFLAWWLVPLTLLALWARYLPRHELNGLLLLAFLTAGATYFGRHTFRLARATLRQRPSRLKVGRPHSLLNRILPVLRGLGRVIAWFLLPLSVVIAFSLSSFVQSPRNSQGEVVAFSLREPMRSLREVDKSVTGLLNFIGIRTYADLREIEVAQKPEGWDGKDWSKVKRVDLRGRNLAFADAESAFLANAYLRDADLTSARLFGAELQGANLNGAELQGADLGGAQLQGADLLDAQLQDAYLRDARLAGADLSCAQLQGTDLREARLAGADLSCAQLQGANLRDAGLQGADLSYAHLQGANLVGAWLQGADLHRAELQGADLRGAALWRALVPEENWDGADLRDSTVLPLTKTATDKTIAGVSASIADKERRRTVVEQLTKALETDNRPSRPEFPATWRSQPNIMFNAGAPEPESFPWDPEPESFPWGAPKWATEDAYDESLAQFLGNLACGRDVPETHTRGLASRALDPLLPDIEPDRLWPKLFAVRVLGPDCPPAKGLPDDTRRRLEQLAAKPGPPKVPEATAPGSK